jgi:hypothetical protein
MRGGILLFSNAHIDFKTVNLFTIFLTHFTVMPDLILHLLVLQ